MRNKGTMNYALNKSYEVEYNIIIVIFKEKEIKNRNLWRFYKFIILISEGVNKKSNKIFTES